MSNPKYQLYCQQCHYKRVFGDEDVPGLSLMKSADIQSGIPKYNELSKKTESMPNKRGKYKGKCPKCGRVIFVLRYNDPTQNDKPS